VRKNAQHVDEAVQRIVTIIKQLSTIVVKSRPPLVKAGVQTLLEGGVRGSTRNTGCRALSPSTTPRRPD
jgi:hypothetical protein